MTCRPIDASTGKLVDEGGKAIKGSRTECTVQGLSAEGRYVAFGMLSGMMLLLLGVLDSYRANLGRHLGPFRTASWRSWRRARAVLISFLAILAAS